MKNLIFVILLLFCPIFLFGQIHLSRDMTLKELTQESGVRLLYTDKNKTFEEVKKIDFKSSYSSKDRATYEKVIWLKFSLMNTDNYNETYYIYSEMAYFSYYQKIEDKWRENNGGYLTPLKDRTERRTADFIPIQIKPYEETTIYVRIQEGRLSLSNQKTGIGTKAFFYETAYKQEEYNRPAAIFSLIYFAGLSMVFIFIGMMYVFNRETVYFYYMFYLFFQLLYSLIAYPEHPLEFINIARYYPEMSILLTETVQFIFIGFYVFFIYKLLDISKISVLGKIVRIFAWLCFLYAIGVFIFYLNDIDLRAKSLTFVISRIVVMPINLALIIWILFKVKHKLINYFVIAHLFFFVGALIAVYIAFTGLKTNPESIFYFENSADMVFQAGLLGEVICFSFALSLRVRLIQKERRDTVRAYIEQLKENEKIQQEMNEELDKKVNEKTEELLQVYLDIEKQRKLELQREFDQKLKEMETMALRSQMNPHFLFNSMNAIKHLIMKESLEDAMHYLDNFSILLRSVLQNSKYDAITVEEELEVLKLYLSMEKIRLGDEYSFEIKVEKNEELSMYAIPSLLLQPIVENAIWHGLIPSAKEKKELIISFEIQDTLVISIRDNGIGRSKSSEKESEDFEIHQSLGLKILRDRLALFNHFQETKIKMDIIDLEENNAPSGTLVTFTYKIAQK